MGTAKPLKMMLSIGSFKTSGKIAICDPIYFDRPDILISVLPGEWLVNIKTDSDNDVLKIIANHTNLNKNIYMPMGTKQKLGHIIVDSAAAGIFDYKYCSKVGKDKLNDLCHKMLFDTNDHNLWVSDHFVGTISGDGDGEYPVYIARDQDDNIIFIEIDFLTQ